MRRLFALFGLMLSLPIVPEAAAQGMDHFVVTDALAPEEVQENTAIYIDQHLVGDFRLDAAHPSGQIAVSVPHAAQHAYALCGRAITRGPKGEATHQVDDSGVITDANGRSYAAYTAGYTVFFLLDTTAGRPASVVLMHRGKRCVSAVASAPANIRTDRRS